MCIIPFDWIEVISDSSTPWPPKVVEKKKWSQLFRNVLFIIMDQFSNTNKLPNMAAAQLRSAKLTKISTKSWILKGFWTNYYRLKVKFHHVSMVLMCWIMHIAMERRFLMFSFARSVGGTWLYILYILSWCKIEIALTTRPNTKNNKRNRKD